MVRPEPPHQFVDQLRVHGPLAPFREREASSEQPTTRAREEGLRQPRELEEHHVAAADALPVLTSPDGGEPRVGVRTIDHHQLAQRVREAVPIQPRQGPTPVMTYQGEWCVRELCDDVMHIVRQRHHPVPARRLVALSVSAKIGGKDEIVLRQCPHDGSPGEPALRKPVQEHHRRLPGIPRRGDVQADAVRLHLPMVKGSHGRSPGRCSVHDQGRRPGSASRETCLFCECVARRRATVTW